jgi:hypothetical protein
LQINDECDHRDKKRDKDRAGKNTVEHEGFLNNECGKLITARMSYVAFEIVIQLKCLPSTIFRGQAYSLKSNEFSKFGAWVKAGTLSRQQFECHWFLPFQKPLAK